jgi:hypothetical protein
LLHRGLCQAPLQHYTPNRCFPYMGCEAGGATLYGNIKNARFQLKEGNRFWLSFSKSPRGRQDFPLPFFTKL